MRGRGTGTGKSTLLRRLILDDVEAGNGVGVIDPHGDLAEGVLAAIPSRRLDDVVYFDPSDLERPIGLNLLDDIKATHARLAEMIADATGLRTWAANDADCGVRAEGVYGAAAGAKDIRAVFKAKQWQGAPRTILELRWITPAAR